MLIPTFVKYKKLIPFMKKVYLIGVILLVGLYFSCNDQDKSPPKTDTSLLEEKVEILKESTRNINFHLNGGNERSIKEEEIILKIKNHSDDTVTFPAPKFDSKETKGWNIDIKPYEEGVLKDGTINLKGKETKELKYKLTGKLLGQEHEEDIKVSFAGKDYVIKVIAGNFNFSLEAQSPTAIYFLEDRKLVVKDLNPITLVIKRTDNIEGHVRVKISDLIEEVGTVNGLTPVLINQDDECTLEKDEQKKLSYEIKGNLGSAKDNQFTFVLKQIGSPSVKIIFKFIKKNEVFQAIYGSNEKFIKAYIAGKNDPNIIINDQTKKTPLNYAATFGREAIAIALTKVASTDVNAIDDRGYTPLHWAIENINIVKALIEVPGVKLDIKNNDGSTALHKAAWSGRSDAVKALLDKGADLKILDVHQNTVLHAAVNQQNESIKSVNYIVYKFKEKNNDNKKLLKEFINAKNIHGETVISKAKEIIKSDKVGNVDIVILPHEIREIKEKYQNILNYLESELKATQD